MHARRALSLMLRQLSGSPITLAPSFWSLSRGSKSGVLEEESAKALIAPWTCFAQTWRCLSAGCANKGASPPEQLTARIPLRLTLRANFKHPPYKDQPRSGSTERWPPELPLAQGTCAERVQREVCVVRGTNEGGGQRRNRGARRHLGAANLGRPGTWKVEALGTHSICRSWEPIRPSLDGEKTTRSPRRLEVVQSSDHRSAIAHMQLPSKTQSSRFPRATPPRGRPPKPEPLIPAVGARRSCWPRSNWEGGWGAPTAAPERLNKGS